MSPAAIHSTNYGKHDLAERIEQLEVSRRGDDTYGGAFSKLKEPVERMAAAGIIWPAYLTADSVATGALGVLVSNLFSHSGTLDPNLQLQAFWAPFLLLHLGGPDTITAYSFEDNELWSRHFLQLIVQTGVAFYILLMAWTGSHISILTMPMILAGLIKYGERTWVLWSASSSERRRSLKPVSQNMVQPSSDGEGDKLLLAYRMFDMAKHLFAGRPIPATKKSATANHQKLSFNVSEKISPKSAFEVIEMQLGFMYDLLYTKALVTYTPCGVALRFTSFLLTIIVLVLFYLAPHNTQRYSKLDLCITFLLLAVAILLELYAALLLLLSDHTVVWLRKHNRNNISQAITSLSLPRNPRWSNSMGQFSFLSYFLNEKPMDFDGILVLLKINEKLEKQRYVAYRQVLEDLKTWLITHSRKYRERLEEFSSEIGEAFSKNFVASITLGYYGLDLSILSSMTKIDFQQAILVWHIATELLYNLDDHYFTQKNQETKCSIAEILQGMAKNTVALNRKMSKHISRYMMYLLAISPHTLPGSEATGLTTFQQTYNEARKRLAESFKPELERLRIEKERKRKIKILASKWLLEQDMDLISLDDVKNGQLNGSLLAYGCAVANTLVDGKPGGVEREANGRRIVQEYLMKPVDQITEKLGSFGRSMGGVTDPGWKRMQKKSARPTAETRRRVSDSFLASLF
ncbi:unnamed protein product [Dovyalis caffra]|uniref:DUF4220 domain-containing protein n=1 Tax=Dovyalis caffra TaxID=77055 RepID=A0AAV1QTX0_9ROSI|nr:unnamed protein product [Dovyalis caffra]